MRRLTLILTLLALLAAAPAAVAQQDPFGPLPQAPQAPTPTPTPLPDVDSQQDTDRTLLFVIGGGLLALFLVIGYVITRDAREHLPEGGRRPAQLREEGPHRHARKAKARARAKTKAQRAARRHNR